MSYTPTSWTTGDTITASALNKIEQGIADASGSGGGTQIGYTIENENVVLDASYNDLKQILLSGSTPYFVISGEDEGFSTVRRYEVTSVAYDSLHEMYDDDYSASAVSNDFGTTTLTFAATTATENMVQRGSI